MFVKKERKFSNLDTVVQSNTIIEATHKLNKNEILAFKKIVSMIDVKYRDRELRIKKRDLIDFLYPECKKKKDTDIQTIYYKRVKEYCMKLSETSLKLHEEGRDPSLTSIAICSKIKWGYKNSYVDIKFSDDIMSFLFELKKCFTQYPIGMLRKLKSKNSIRIYEYCKMNLHSNKEKYTWSVPLIELKRLLDLENCYPRFNSFNERVLSACIPEINEKTNLNIEYDTVREFCNVIELIFTVKEKYPKTKKEIQSNKELWNEKAI